MNNELNPLVPLIGLGIFGVVVVTAPYLLAKLLGIEPKRCECGIKATPEGFNPYCECTY